MTKTARKILVTSALPYASGPIHIGHLVEYIQTDIWVRFQRLVGNQCTYICASDAHGTPIMLRARDEGISPEELVARFREEHQRDFAAFRIEFDNFYTTHSDENQALVETVYQRLSERQLIVRRTIEQAYDEEEKMFLPDRFVRGTCPRCQAVDQYGDSCEVCGNTYSPSELTDAKSVLSGSTPVSKESEHYFFRLSKFEDSLRAWIADGHVNQAVARKLNEWFEAGLQDWDISRDAPYFGIRIPDTDDKYFYVWLDAPLGYMASLVDFANKTAQPDLLGEYFNEDSTAELYHFIGKDIAYFHTLFWPAVLEGAGYRKPSGVYVHGFLTINGQKMAKRRGTFIAAAEYLSFLNPECLRYYYAVKLGPGIDDIDLNLEDFVARTNSDLVGKYVNIASRCSGFISKRFDGQLADKLDNEPLYLEFAAAGEQIADHYEAREYSRAMRAIMQLADRANQYVDEHKPWQLAREDGGLPRVQLVCTQALNFFRVLTIYLKPVIPGITAGAEAFLGGGVLDWQAVNTPLLDTRINAFEPLLTRIEESSVAAMVEASKSRASG